MIEKILVAVDGSENSNRALDFALDLAEKYRASVLVLNVFQLPPSTRVPEDAMTAFPSTLIVPKDFQKIHEEILTKALARAREVKPNVTVESKLREGEPALEIVDEAKTGGFGVVVVGHKGMGRVREIFMGNISEKVAHLAPCPVIIVK